MLKISKDGGGDDASQQPVSAQDQTLTQHRLLMELLMLRNCAESAITLAAESTRAGIAAVAPGANLVLPGHQGPTPGQMAYAQSRQLGENVIPMAKQALMHAARLAALLGVQIEVATSPAAPAIGSDEDYDANVKG